MKHFRCYPLALFALGLAALVATGTAGGGRHARGVSGSISIIAKWTGDEQKSFLAVVAEFKKKNPNVDVKYTPGGDNTPQLVSTAVAGGNPPDIAVLPQPGLMRDLAKRGAAKPIEAALLRSPGRLRPRHFLGPRTWPRTPPQPRRSRAEPPTRARAAGAVAWRPSRP